MKLQKKLSLLLVASSLFFSSCASPESSLSESSSSSWRSSESPSSSLISSELSSSSSAASSPASSEADPDSGLIASYKADYLKKANEVEVTDTAVRFTDANGNKMEIRKNPSKVVNLYASFTTLWYEAGGTCAGVIGGSSSVSQYEDYIGRDITKDEGVTVVATSSAGKRWKTEPIIAMNPDFIICSTAMSGYKTISTPAQNANIPVIACDYEDFADYLKWFKVFSNLTGHAELYDSVALKALDQVISVRLETKDLEKPKVLEIFGGTTASQANTKNTVMGEMLDEVNGENIVDSWAGADTAERLDINMEAVAAANPYYILVQCHAGEDEIKKMIAETYGDNAVWNSLDAVKNNRVYYMSKLLFHNKPNHKFAEAYQTLAETIHPHVSFSWKSGK